MAIPYLTKRDLIRRGVVVSVANLATIVAVFVVFSSVLQVHLTPELAGVVVLLLSTLVFSTSSLTTKILLFSGRSREIAVLRALGAKKSSVMKVWVIESVLMGLVGSLLGSFLGTMILFGLRVITNISFSRDLVVLAVFLGIAATMTSGLYSARKSMDMEVGGALRDERW